MIWTITVVNKVVFAVLNFSEGNINCRVLVKEDLTIAQVPISTKNHQNRGELKYRETLVVDSVVKHRRLPIVICKQDALSEVVIHKAKQRNRKEHWKCHSMREGYHHDVYRV